MSDTATIQLRKFMSNPLLCRKQCIVDVIHPNKPNVRKTDISQMIAKHISKSKAENVVIFGMRTHFGGGKSTGFALIYESKEALMKFEPKYRLIRLGLAEAVEGSKKNRAEAKRRGKKVRGTGRRLAKKKARRAAE